MPIGSIISGVANMHNALVNTGLGIANTAMQYGQNIQNQKNYEEAFEYQKELNNLLMQREDNAYQRKAADLAKAGINPMLAGLGGGAQASAGTVLNPLQQSAPQIPMGTGSIDVNSIVNALESKTNREFSAAEADKNRRLEQQRIDIDKFNAETSRMQEENADKYKALEDQLANKQLDEQIRHNLEQEKSSVDQLNALMQKTANDYDIAKRNAKTAEERLDMDKINSEAQRKITAVQGILMNNRISYEEKEAAIKAEEHEWQRQITGMELTKGTVNTALNIFDRIKDCVFFWKRNSK